MKRLAIMLGICWLGAAAAEEPSLESLFVYEFGKPSEAWAEIEAMTRHPLARERKAAEQILSRLLMSREASPDARVLACRGLRLVGEETAVPVLISELRNERLSSEARMGVERKADADIDRACREAVALLPNRLKLGLLSTIANRRDPAAVTVVATLAKGLSDPEVQTAAIRALGRIGTPEAWTALASMSPTSPGPRRALGHAWLDCALRMAEHPPSKAKGLAALKGLTAEAMPRSIRLGALREIARLDPASRPTLANQIIDSKNGSLLDALGPVARLLSEAEAKELYASRLSSAPPSARVILVSHWRPVFGQVEAIREFSLRADAEPALRQAALAALELLPSTTN